MRLLNESIDESGSEKHVPVVESIEEGIKVKVGSIPHPMEEDHYIEWIEVISGDTIFRKHLNPNDVPEAIFKTKNENIIAREYCSVHGQWRN
jgi:superoxide reductase